MSILQKSWSCISYRAFNRDGRAVAPFSVTDYGYPKKVLALAKKIFLNDWGMPISWFLGQLC